MRDTKAARNIIVTIDSLVQKLSGQTTNLQDVSAEKIKKTLGELLIRSVRNAKIAF